MAHQQESRVVQERNTRVPMRDGTRLAADIRHPDAHGRLPSPVARGSSRHGCYPCNPDWSLRSFLRLPAASRTVLHAARYPARKVLPVTPR